jgi:hypothetical protein
VHLLLAYRWLIFIVGLLMLMYASVVLLINHLFGAIALLPVEYLLLLCISYNITPSTARLGAWIGTLDSQDY